MIENNNNQPPIDNSIYTHFVGVKFSNAPRAYFFGVKNMPLNLGDKVVVETMRGMELGEITFSPIEMDKYESPLGLKPVLRIATDVDKKLFDANIKDAEIAMNICVEEVKKLNLNMNLISCEYTLDRSKIIFSYLADERVDFRELLKVLAARLHSRIELRQIGSRDKAKMIGGIGVCGLPLCCSTFLNEFDGISITRAKNQMLAINIPKLSGHCGKLICCLKYEDDAYTDLRKQFPELGSKVWIDKQEYTITSINVISRVVKIENAEEVKFLSLEELKKQGSFPKKRDRDNNRDNRPQRNNNNNKNEKN
ncbi:MAG: stage 0 sporulation protein [Bacilli bacterium]|nr:stage 0 sporulation protein [Bacilli bacterium]